MVSSGPNRAKIGYILVTRTFSEVRKDHMRYYEDILWCVSSKMF